MKPFSAPKLPLMLLLAWALSACATTPQAAVTQHSIQHNAATVTGGLWLVPVSADIQAEASAGRPPTFQGQPVWVGDVGGDRLAVIGLGLTDAGEKVLLAADGRTLAGTTVGARAYAEQHLTLTQTQYVNPDTAQTARFEREAAEQKSAYRVYTPLSQPHWPAFQWPLQGRVSSLFGLRRFFNGEPRAPHLGIDIAGKLGTPVRAPASGRVALVGDYFFNGRTVIIDHGQGLFSMLCHFSDINVRAGDVVTQKTVIGLVGATGRATAPHLHWTVSLNDARIDPRRLLVKVPDSDR